MSRSLAKTSLLGALAFNQDGGRISPHVPVVESLASPIWIGSGGSVGREGPIVQIGSALGSVCGQSFGLSESRLRLLVACGAVGGISATLNAPIAGVFFSLVLILRKVQTQAFGVVVLSVTADAIGRAAFGNHPFLSVPAFDFSLRSSLCCTRGSVLATGVGLGFVRVLYVGEDLADRLWRGPDWLRPAAGGILLGLLLRAADVRGRLSGAGARGRRPLHDPRPFGLLAAEVLATSLTMWIGGSGGMFAPSLLIGATLGAAYGAIAHHTLPRLAAAAGAYGLVGTGAVFAAAARAPITAVLISFELTGDYRTILPLMLGELVGWLRHRRVLRAYHQHSSKRPWSPLAPPSGQSDLPEGRSGSPVAGSGVDVRSAWGEETV